MFKKPAIAAFVGIAFLFTQVLVYARSQVSGQEKPILAVITLQPLDGITLSEAIQITQVIEHTLVASGQYDLVERTLIDKIASDGAIKIDQGCDVECAIRIGHLLSAQKIITGTAGKLGKAYAIQARLIDVRSGKIEKSSYIMKECAIEELPRYLQEITAQLVEAPAEKPAEGRLTDEAEKGRPVVKVQPVVNRETGKKRKFPLLLVGGLALGGGVVAALLLARKGANTGTISVSSSPTGAKVRLDGTETGKTTNCTLTHVSPGVHTITLEKDGCQTYEESVDVAAGQTATVSVNLLKDIILVTSPIAGAVWAPGMTVGIEWQSSTSVSSRNRMNVSTANKAISLQQKIYNLQAQRMLGSRSLDDQVGTGAKRSATRRRSAEDNISARDSAKARVPSESTARTAVPGQGQAAMPPASENQKSALRPITGAVQGSARATALAIAAVNIELYKGGLVYTTTIAEETANDGSYSWLVGNSLPNGTDYQIRVSCSTDPSVYDLSDTFTISSDPYENNNSRSTAAPFSLSGAPLSWQSAAGTVINPLTDQDWFRFTGQQGESYEVTVDVTSELDPRVVLYFGDSMVLDMDVGFSGDDESFVYAVPTSGTYYIGVGYYAAISSPQVNKLTSIQADTGSYTLRVVRADPYEPNESRAAATAVTFNGTPPTWQSIPGTVVSPYTDQDWYQFSANPGELIEVICDLDSLLDPKVVLYRGDEKIAESDAIGDGAGESISHLVTVGGTYYVGVGFWSMINVRQKGAATNNLASTGSYTLRIVKTS